MTIQHANAITGDLKTLIARQKSIAAQRIEPVEWRIHQHLAAHGLVEPLGGQAGG